MKKNKKRSNPDTKQPDSSLSGGNRTLKNRFEELSVKYQEILQAKEKAETSVALKSQFLANVSHDLRTPLHAILSYSRFGIEKIERLEKEKITKYFSNIEESGKKLQEMLNKIVDLSRLESGKMVFQLYSSNLSLMIQSVVKENRELLDSKRIVVETNMPTDLNTVICDQNKILQAMSILFKNTIYHAPENSAVLITIENVTVCNSGSEAGLEISFKDQRTDPAPSEAIEDFDAYMEKERIKTGLRIDGITLAIAYEIVKHHRGSFQVQNIPSGGSVYSFTLPLKQPERG